MLRPATIIVALLLAVTFLIPTTTRDRVLAQTPHEHRPSSSQPAQVGQAAFATIQEIVEILERDPNTDWSKVNIEALRQHLIDMDAVTVQAEVKTEQVKGGMLFKVIGMGSVRDSIQRMVLAHAASMDGVGGWKFKVKQFEDGAALTVLVPTEDLAKLKGLGFIGVLVRGMHHQGHHLMLARGEKPHHRQSGR